jgi:hypothetical protein
MAFLPGASREKSVWILQLKARYSALSFCRLVRRIKPEVTLLSAEQFLGFKRRDLAKFGNWLRLDAFSSIEFVVYVRDPVEWVASKALEQLKVGALGFREGFFTPLGAVRRFSQDVREVLGGTLHLRAYEKNVLHGGDVRKDLVTEFLPPLEATQLSYPTILKNTSVSAEGGRILAAYREEHHPGLPPKAVPLEVRTLLRKILEIEQELSRPKPELLEPVALAVRVQAARDLDWLRRQQGLTASGSTASNLLEVHKQSVPPVEFNPDSLGSTAVERVDNIFQLDRDYLAWLQGELFGSPRLDPAGVRE